MYQQFNHGTVLSMTMAEVVWLIEYKKGRNQSLTGSVLYQLEHHLALSLLWYQPLNEL